ncbi:unnamed protein product [Prunus brigantina]
MITRVPKLSGSTQGTSSNMGFSNLTSTSFGMADCSATMSFKGRSQSSNSQVPLYLWSGSKDMHVKLAKPLFIDVPRVDPNNSRALVITFHPFYFSLGFTFPSSKFFNEMFCVMECAPSQCTLNVYRAIICFENLSHFFKLDMTVREFFYFFEVKRYEKDAQLRVKWKGEVGDGPLIPLTYCDDPNDLLAKQKKSSTELPDKRKANSKSIGDEVATSRSRDGSPQRKKPRLLLPRASLLQRGSHLLRRFPQELLLLHLPGSSPSSVQTTRRLVACRRFRIFCSSLRSNSSKPVIYPVRRLLRSRDQVVCAGLGIKLRGLYPCSIITTRLPSHE